jgi:hypothetical protein
MLFLVCGLAQQASSQSVFDIQAISPVPDTLNIGQTDSIYVVMINRGPNLFNGTINFNYSINDSTYQTPNDTSGLYFNPITTVVDSGDTVTTIIFIHPNSPKFQTGPSVVVIWPISVVTPIELATRDSLIFTLEILDTTVIDTVDTIVNNINGPINMQIVLLQSPSLVKKR